MMMRHYSLIDGALIYDTLCANPFFTDPTIPWYVALLPGENRRLAGPILIDRDLLNAEDDATKLAVDDVLNGFPGRLHASQLHSENDLATLAHHLQRFTCFYDEDALLLGLRFADTRILMNLPHALSLQQWCEMTAPIQRWTFLNRRVEEVSLDLPEDRANVMVESKPFTLSAQQMDVLINAAEPDMLLYQLNYTPHRMGNHMQAYWELAQQCVQIWQQSGAKDRGVLRRFAIKVFNSNGQTLHEHDWVKLLAKATPNDLLTS